MSGFATSRVRRYVLKVVSNGDYVFICQLERGRHHEPILNFAAKQMREEDAPSFGGGPWLDTVIAEAEKGGMDLFPIRVDR
jgi:hypothetical protein